MGALTDECLCFYIGDEADIGAGALADWEEVEAFRDLYFQGAEDGQAAGVDAGNANHLHAGNAHTHTGDEHTHTLTLGGTVIGTTIRRDTTVSATFVAKLTHTHTSVPSQATIIAYQTTTVAANITVAGTKPQSIRVFGIAPSSGQTPDIPDGVLVMTDEEGTPEGFTISPTVGGYFPIGVAAAADDAGDTFGDDTHGHLATNHTHVEDPHVHANKNIGGTIGSENNFWRGFTCAHFVHTHTFTNFQNKVTGNLSTNVITISTGPNKPDYHKLLGIENTSGGELTPIGVIIGFIGAEVDIPRGFVLCDGTDETPDLEGRQIEFAVSKMDIGPGDADTSNSHTHTEDGHEHTHGFHTHGYLVVALGESAPIGNTFPGATMPNPLHGHSLSAVGLTTPTLQAQTATFQNTDGRPPYRTLKWIKYMGVPTVHIESATIYGNVEIASL